MGEKELYRELDRRFDEGAPLRPGLESALELHPPCAAYCTELEAVATALEVLPWHEPDPQLAYTVKRRIQEEETPAFQRFGNLLSGMVACAVVSIMAGIYLQPYLPYTDIERQVMSFRWQSLLQHEGALLEPVPLSALDGIPYAEQTLRWLDLEPLYRQALEWAATITYPLTLSGAYFWLGLLGACGGILLFNGVLLRSVGGNTLIPTRH